MAGPRTRCRFSTLAATFRCNSPRSGWSGPAWEDRFSLRNCPGARCPRRNRPASMLNLMGRNKSSPDWLQELKPHTLLRGIPGDAAGDVVNRACGHGEIGLCVQALPEGARRR